MKKPILIAKIVKKRYTKGGGVGEAGDEVAGRARPPQSNFRLFCGRKSKQKKEQYEEKTNKKIYQCRREHRL